MTAMGLLAAAAAVSILPSRRSLALRIATVEVLGGVGIVAAHALQLTDGEVIRTEWWSSVFTGVAFAVSGSAAMLLALGRLAAGQVVAFGVLMFAGLLGLGHLFPTADLYAYLPGTGVAIPTVLAFLAVSVGQLLSFADTGVSGAFTSRNPAGASASPMRARWP